MEQSKNLFSTVVPYLIPSAAAAVAIVPVFGGLVTKSELQLNKPVSKMSVKQVCTQGLKAAPILSVIVGIQVGSQTLVEKLFTKGQQEDTSLAKVFASTLVVGALSAPALAVFNGQTTGKTFKQSLQGLNFWQSTAIVARETSFLLALRVSGLVNESLKKYGGDNLIVSNVSSFVSGFMGSLVGHMPDTALTLWQNHLEIRTNKEVIKADLAKTQSKVRRQKFSILKQNLPGMASNKQLFLLNVSNHFAQVKSYAKMAVPASKHLYQGGVVKAVTLGSFTILYDNVKNYLNKSFV